MKWADDDVKLSKNIKNLSFEFVFNAVWNKRFSNDDNCHFFKKKILRKKNKYQFLQY